MKTKIDIEKDFQTWKIIPKTITTKKEIKAWFQKRGYALELIIFDLLVLEDLEPTPSYKLKGEQIDGAFKFNSQYFLYEVKWHKYEINAGELYKFKGKIQGKLKNTLGVFLSMSGYTKEAVSALTVGKEIDLILFDQTDFEYCLNSKFSFKEVLEFKIRFTVEKGLPYVQFNPRIKRIRTTPFLWKYNFVEGMNEKLFISSFLKY